MAHSGIVRFRVIAATATVTLLGCAGGTSDRHPDTRDDASAAGASVAGASVAGASVAGASAAGASAAGASTLAGAPTWYRQARTLDLTGDGVADTVRLDATGTTPDSLRLTLSLVVGGAVMHDEEWGSSYELTVVDSSRRSGPQADATLRARLDSVLASVRVQRFDDPGVRIMAEDSAILAGLEPRPTSRISFAYGYESTVRLVWDAPRRRFVRLWSCC